MLAAYLLCLFVAHDVVSVPSYRRTVIRSQVTPTLVEGDIAVPQRHLETGQPLAAFLTEPSALWPRGLVSYCIQTFEWEGKVEPIFSAEGVANITQALGQIMRDVPCIKFREVSEGYMGAHLVFTSMGGPKCFSSVGRVIDGGGQLVNLGSPGCTNIGVVLHETLHALGAVHEHSRSDRDLFITILYENIQPGARHNFDRVDSNNHNAWNTPFDTRSVMMYGEFDFGINGTLGPKITIQPLKAGTDIRGAETKTELSLVDKVELGRAYQPITGEECFNYDNLLMYAEYVDSVRLSFQSLPTPGCRIEEDTNYFGSDIRNGSVAVKSLQACADLCASLPGELFWTFRKSDNHCWIKYSDSGRRHQHGFVSGTKQCGKKRPQSVYCGFNMCG